ncbi:excinuclease ABC subunit B [Moritella sp. 36]|uniref:excinuclease ABC subunit B n=1 Tax=Moritella sp. 36 TaxID=2746233 RepID=UPI001BA9E42B|nr:excinuclease ABC subunit B [Moritella sp. 36]QUM89084.1 excinuclease ABC subunit B [Moritella sp. 36]
MNKKYFKMSYAALFVASGLANSSPIDGIDDAYFHGADQFQAYKDPRTACDVFNQKVKYINSVLSQTEGAGHISNLCQAVRFTDGQIEDTYYLTTVNGAYQDGSNSYPVTEQLDVARTIDLLMFSQSNKTDYVVIVDGSVDVSKQTVNYGGEISWYDENVLPFFWYREGYIGQVFHGNSQFNYIAGESAYASAEFKAMQETNDDSEIERLTWKYLADTCGDGAINASCIPQGKGFGNQLIGTETFPSSTNAAGNTVDIANSTSFSFNITGDFQASKSDGPSAGLGVGFGFDQTTSSSQTHNVLTLKSVGQGNDIGTAVTQKINTLALGAAAEDYQASNDGWNRVVNAAEIWGEDLYRSYPLTSYEAWQENYTEDSSSCTSQNLIFGNSLKIARTHLNMYGSNWDIADEDTKIADADYGVVVATECTTDQKGQTFRLKKETLL